MSKLNVRICTCGRIHFIPEAEIDGLDWSGTKYERKK